jgi:diadenylate cyclase
MAEKTLLEVEEEKITLIDVLRIVSPGTTLRTAIDDILRAEMGALIVVYSDKIKDIMEGGFDIDTPLSSQKIVELAKMDGAIIVSEDLKKIMNANVMLVPDVSIKTEETGTRHKAAERTAKQCGTLVIAVSERRKKITIYNGYIRYILQNPDEILSRAVETLQILEKQREIFNELLSNLNLLEISSLVAVGDVCSVLQRIEIIMRTAKMMERYLIELGKEGGVIKMRLRELLKNIDREKILILQDYDTKEDTLNEFGFDDLLESENIANLLFSLSSDNKITPKGYRILSKMNLGKREINKLVEHFNNLNDILEADSKKLEEVLGDDMQNFNKEVSSLKEQIMMAKKI